MSFYSLEVEKTETVIIPKYKPSKEQQKFIKAIKTLLKKPKSHIYA